MSSSGYLCDFTTPGNPPQCDPYSFEGFSYNVYLVSIFSKQLKLIIIPNLGRMHRGAYIWDFQERAKGWLEF